MRESENSKFSEKNTPTNMVKIAALIRIYCARFFHVIDVEVKRNPKSTGRKKSTSAYRVNPAKPVNATIVIILVSENCCVNAMYITAKNSDAVRDVVQGVTKS